MYCNSDWKRTFPAGSGGLKMEEVAYATLLCYQYILRQLLLFSNKISDIYDKRMEYFYI